MAGVSFYLATACVLSVLVATGAQLVNTCLDMVASGERCCTLSAFVKLSFTLRLNSGGCDPPSYLDQGVRLEVHRPGSSWEPLRFYTSTREISSNSLVTLMSSTRVMDENNSQFPLYENQSTEPFRVTEYLCGNEYYSPGTEYRWLQRYSGSASQAMETWTLSNVSITYSERGVHCSAQLVEASFRNFDGSELSGAIWSKPACEQESLPPLAVYFNDVSVVDGSAQRSVVVIPEWWNAACLPRTIAGCVLSVGCAVSDIGDNMCSLGSGLQCRCQHPQLTGNGNMCIDGTVGFSQTMYDVGEGNSVEVCVVVLQGKLMEEVRLHFVTHSGTAAVSDFAGRSVAVTLSPTAFEDCVSIMVVDDSAPEETEFLTVSVSLIGELNSVQLTQNTATIYIVDNDIVTIDVNSTLIREGERAHVNVSLTGQSTRVHRGVNVKCDSGTATVREDFLCSSRFVSSNKLASKIPLVKDNIWEGSESFTVNITVLYMEDQYLAFTTIYIIDTDEVSIGFNASKYTVSEAVGSVMVCVTLQNGSIGGGVELNVAVSTQDESAQEVLDYSGVSNVVTLSSSVHEQCVPVVIVDDRAVELTENLTVFISLTGEISNVLFTQQSAAVLILDNDDVEIGFVQPVYTASEHNMSIMVCVEVKHGLLGIPIHLSISSHSQSTQEGSDYTNLSDIVILSPLTERCVAVVLIDDLMLEETESLMVSLSLTGELTSVQLTQHTATILITDDDEVTVGFAASSYTTSEAVAVVEVCVTLLSGQLGTDITLQLDTHNGTAEEVSDYTRLSAAVTLSATPSEDCVSIRIVDDSVLEETESLMVSLSLIGERTRVQLAQHLTTLLITDDDEVTVEFAASSYTTSEADTAVQVCLTVVTGQLGTDITLQLDTLSGSAQEESDYARLSATVTLSATASEDCVLIRVVDDLVLEEMESLMVSVSLTGELTSVQLTQHTATILITDDDELTVGFAASSYTTSEADAVVEVCVSVLSGQLGTNITLQLDTHSRTAEEVSDYARLSTAVILSPTASEDCVSIRVVHDSVLEETESLVVSLSLTGELTSVQLTQRATTILISDDDEVTVGFTASSYSTSEADDVVEVCVTLLSGYLGTDITLQLDTHNGTAEEGSDYTRLSAAVTLSATASEDCVSISVVDDSVLEETESLVVSLSLTGVLTSVQLTQHTATILITNDDIFQQWTGFAQTEEVCHSKSDAFPAGNAQYDELDRDVTVGFAASSYTISEADAVVEVCVTVLSGQLGTDIALRLDTHSGTAEDVVDYSGLSAAVTLSATASEDCVSIRVVDDSVLEETESLMVSLSLTGELTSVLLTIPFATLHITNDDGVTVGFAASSYSTSEHDDVVEVCVTLLSGYLGTNITLQLDTHNGTAEEVSDYAGLSSAVTLSATASEDCVSIRVVDDSVLEETESLMVSVSLTGKLTSVQLTQHTATILITDDDYVEIGFVQSVYTASELNMSVMVCVEVKHGLLGIPLRLSITSHSQSSQANDDYTITGSELTLIPSRTNSCAIDINIVNDVAVELTESVTVSLSLIERHNRVRITQPTATVLITDDDEVRVGFSANSYTTSEANDVEVCVTVLSGQLGTDITLQLDTHRGTAEDGVDYTQLAGTVTLSPTASKKCASVDVIDDRAVELAESFTVSFSLIGELDSVQLIQHNATIFIADNDEADLGFRNIQYTTSEADTAVQVCVTVLKGMLGTVVTLQLDTHSETAEDGVDYTRFTGSVTLSPTTSVHCVSVMIENDSLLEETEILTVSLSMSHELNSVQLTVPTATILITDDDGIEVGLNRSSYTVHEDVGILKVCVMVLDSGELGTNLDLQLSTYSGTAQDIEDYKRLSEVLTLSPNASEQCVPFEVINDRLVEQNESLTVSVSLSGEMNSVQLTRHTATVLIIDNDVVDVGFRFNSYSTSEPEAVIEVCVAVVTGHLGTDIRLQLVTHSGTAIGGIDYTELSAVITLSATASEDCVSIGVVDDSVLEETEFLTVTLSLIRELNSVQLTEHTATILITDDDGVHVGFANDSYIVNETETEVKVCVSVVGGQLGTEVMLQLDTHSGTARGDIDYNSVSSDLILSPTAPERCVSVNVVDDKAVELSESLTISLSLTGELNVQITKENITVLIYDDDVAVIGLEQMNYVVASPEEEQVTVQVVEVCVVTNNTLERTFVLSLITGPTNTSFSDKKGLELLLLPGDKRACIMLNISTMEEMVFFSVQSDEVTGIKITSPNGTIIVEPSLDGVADLLSHPNVDVGQVVDALEGIVDELIASGQTATYEFTEKLVGVVSKLLNKSNKQSFEQTQRDRKRRQGSKKAGTRLLETLDNFALKSFNASLGIIKDDNVRLQVIMVAGSGVKSGRRSETEAAVTGIIGAKNESIDIPTELFQNQNSTVEVASYYLRNVSGLLSNTLPGVIGAEVVSSVLSSALGCGDNFCDQVVDTTELIRITLQHRKIQGESEEARCVYWNLSISEWSEDGCVVNDTESNETVTVCYCNHLTHFAVMLSPKDSVDTQNAYNLRLIGYVGMTISLVCLLITIFIFCCFKALWSMRNYIHVNLCINLFIAQLIFVAGIDKTGNQIVCQSIAVTLHYSFLVTFMWMLMEGVVLYVALVKVFVTKPHRYIISFTVVSYGAPLLYMALVVPLGFLLSDEQHYGGDICWLKSHTHFIWAFAAPVILIILANVGFFIMALYIIWKQQRKKQLTSTQMHKAKHWLKVSVSLLVIMGITWIIGVLTFHEALLFVSYIFTITVAFQGALIFILFVVLSKQVRVTLKKWLVRNIISKSGFLSEHLSEFTRSTQAGYSQSHSHSSSSKLEKSTIAGGIQLGTFSPLPEDTVEIKNEIQVTVSPSPPPSVVPTPQPPTPSPPSPSPEPPSIPNEKEDADAVCCDPDPPNSFTVIFVSSDRDSGQSSTDTDVISTPPPVSPQQLTGTKLDKQSITNTTD